MMINPMFQRAIYEQQKRELEQKIEWNRRIKEEGSYLVKSYPWQSWIGQRLNELIARFTGSQPCSPECGYRAACYPC